MGTIRSGYSPAEYTRRSLIISLYLSLIIAFIILILVIAFGGSYWVCLPFFAIFYVFFFYTFIHKPSYDILIASKIVDSEIVSMIRFLILELKSERSLFGALINTSKNFSLIGIYLDEIVDKVKLGKTLEQSLNEAVESCPSANLRNVYWQLLNSLQTGADITLSLKTQLDDVIEEQKIKVEEYGRELNAYSLFYMMIAIIVPTIGFTIIMAVLTFIGIGVTLPLLITFWLILSVVQYFFLRILTSRKPSVEAY